LLEKLRSKMSQKAKLEHALGKAQPVDAKKRQYLKPTLASQLKRNR
jgi:hypothetical protein